MQRPTLSHTLFVSLAVTFVALPVLAAPSILVTPDSRSESVRE